MMGWSPRCYIPNFVEIGPPVPEKKIFEGFLPYMGVVANLNKLPHYPRRLHIEFGFDRASGFEEDV